MAKKMASKSGNEDKSGSPEPKKRWRKPSVVFRQELPAIAEALAKKAKSGSYLHAKTLRELAEMELAKKTFRRRGGAFAKKLMAMLEEAKRPRKEAEERKSAS
jgi:hypothetical protein